jgi:hypothetical protein
MINEYGGTHQRAGRQKEKNVTRRIKYFYFPLEQGGPARVRGLRTPVIHRSSQ